MCETYTVYSPCIVTCARPKQLYLTVRIRMQPVLTLSLLQRPYVNVIFSVCLLHTELFFVAVFLPYIVDQGDANQSCENSECSVR